MTNHIEYIEYTCYDHPQQLELSPNPTTPFATDPKDVTPTTISSSIIEPDFVYIPSYFLLIFVAALLKKIKALISSHAQLAQVLRRSTNLMRCQIYTTTLSRGKFNMFSDASDLKAIILKSQVCFEGINKFTKETILTMLGYEVGELCFKYLGVPNNFTKEPCITNPYIINLCI